MVIDDIHNVLNGNSVAPHNIPRPNVLNPLPRDRLDTETRTSCARVRIPSTPGPTRVALVPFTVFTLSNSLFPPPRLAAPLKNDDLRPTPSKL